MENLSVTHQPSLKVITLPGREKTWIRCQRQSMELSNPGLKTRQMLIQTWLFLHGSDLCLSGEAKTRSRIGGQGRHVLTRVIVPDSEGINGDLRDHSLVETLLRCLSKHGCIVIKNAVSNVSGPDDPEIARNEVTTLILRRARLEGRYAVFLREKYTTGKSDRKWRRAEKWKELLQGDCLQAVYCCYLLAGPEVEYRFEFQSPSQIPKAVMVNGKDIILVTGPTMWKIPVSAHSPDHPDLVEVRYKYIDPTPVAATQ